VDITNEALMVALKVPPITAGPGTYPVAHENDAERAARAALSIQRSLSEINRKNAGAGKLRSTDLSATQVGAPLRDEARCIAG
jgi:hypothetical protein